MSKTFQLITNLLIGLFAFGILIFTGMGIFEIIDGMRIYTASEDSFVYALEDGRYGDLVSDYHRNLVSDIKATETMEECYAIARYYEATLDYQLAVQEEDLEWQQSAKEKMEAAASRMGELSYAKGEIDELLDR